MKKIGLVIIAAGLTVFLIGCDSRPVESTEEVVESIEIGEVVIPEASEIVTLGENAIISQKVWGKIGDEDEISLSNVTVVKDDEKKTDLLIKFKVQGEDYEKEYVYNSATNETSVIDNVAIPYDVKIVNVDIEHMLVTVRIKPYKHDLPYLDLSGDHNDIYVTRDYCYSENDTLVVLFGPGRELRGDFLEVLKSGILNHEENLKPEGLKAYYGNTQIIWDNYFSGENPFTSYYVDKNKFCLIQVQEETTEYAGWMFWWVGKEPVLDIEDLPITEFSREEKETLYGDFDF